MQSNNGQPFKPVQWQEPVSFKNAIDRKYRPQPKRFLRAAGVSVGLTALALAFYALRGPMDGNWPKSVMLSVGAGIAWFALMLAFAGINYIAPRLLVINDQGFFVKDWQGPAMRFTTYRWDIYSHCTIEQTELEGKRYLTVAASLHNGNRHLYGISTVEAAGKAPINEIVSAIQSHGLQVQRLA